MRRGNSIISMLMAFVWAILIICSDDVLVYADYDCQKSATLSSVILDGTDVWAEADTEFVLQDSNSLRNRLRSSNYQSRERTVQSELFAQRYGLQFIQCRKYIWPFEIERCLNEKIIMNYLHRQDGDK